MGPSRLLATNGSSPASVYLFISHLSCCHIFVASRVCVRNLRIPTAAAFPLATSRFLANTSFRGQTGHVSVHNVSHIHTEHHYKVWSLLRDSVGQPTWVTVGNWKGGKMEAEEGLWPQHLQRKNHAEGSGFSRMKLRVVTLVEHPFVFTREVCSDWAQHELYPFPPFLGFVRLSAILAFSFPLFPSLFSLHWSVNRFFSFPSVFQFRSYCFQFYIYFFFSFFF